MAGRFTNPFPQFSDSTPAMYSGGFLKFYASGTSTPLAVYSDSLATVSIGTSVTLNSAGRPSTLIYLADVAYKVTLEYPASTVIWTADPVYARDAALVAKTSTGSGSPNGTVAGTAGSAGVLPDFYFDYTNAIYYVATTTGSSSTTVWTAINASASTPAVPTPQGYLTPTSGLPIITSDASAQTAIYYTPKEGNLVPIYNGTSMVPTEFSELTLTLVSQHALSTIYDVFVFSNSGVLTLVTGPAWTVSTVALGARGTGAGTSQLSRVKGLWVNTVAMTGRNSSTTYSIGANLATYVGSIYVDGTAGQVTCHRTFGQSRKWGIWNAYNRHPVTLLVGDGTASWTYTSTWRVSNADATNRGDIFVGLPEEVASYDFSEKLRAPTAVTSQIGIGYNSTVTPSAMTGDVAQSTGSGNVDATTIARFSNVPVIGFNRVSCIEQVVGGTGTFIGTSASMLMTVRWRA